MSIFFSLALAGIWAYFSGLLARALKEGVGTSLAMVGTIVVVIVLPSLLAWISQILMGSAVKTEPEWLVAARLVLLQIGVVGAVMTAIAFLFYRVRGNHIVSSEPYREKMSGKVICIKEATVYTEMDSLSPTLTRLPPGSEVELIEAMEKNDVQWVNIRLPDGQLGYILERNLEKNYWMRARRG